MLKFKNGLITECSLPFEINLIPKKNKTSRSQLELIPDSITIHNIGDSTTALQNTQYIDNAYERYASWHFTIGEDKIYQELPINEVAWHAGDGYKGKGNRTSIAIEIIETEKAKELAIKFIKLLVKELGITNIVPHKHWSGKNCPRKILPIWDEFIAQIKGESIMTKKDIQRHLKTLGYYTGAIDGDFGPMSKSAVIRFQSDRGLTVDGSPGPATQAEILKAIDEREIPSLSIEDRMSVVEQRLAEIEKKL